MAETERVLPKHVRLAGVAYILTAAMAFAFTLNQVTWENKFYGKLLAIVPASAILGVWFILDASALAAGRRRYQLPILVGLLGVALALAFYVSEMLQRGGLPW